MKPKPPRCIDCYFCRPGVPLLDAICLRSMGRCLAQRFDNQHGHRPDRCGLNAQFFRAKAKAAA